MAVYIVVALRPGRRHQHLGLGLGLRLRLRLRLRCCRCRPLFGVGLDADGRRLAEDELAVLRSHDYSQHRHAPRCAQAGGGDTPRSVNLARFTLTRFT